MRYVIRGVLAIVLLTAALDVSAACGWVLVKTGASVCTSPSTGGGEICTDVYVWYYFECSPPGGTGGGGDVDPGGGSGGGWGDDGLPADYWDDPASSCPTSLYVYITDFEASPVSEFAVLHGFIAPATGAPEGTSVRWRVDGPGTSAAGYGAGEIWATAPLTALPTGLGTYTLTVQSSTRCGAEEWTATAFAVRSEQTKDGLSSETTYFPPPSRTVPLATVAFSHSESFSSYDLWGVGPSGPGSVHTTWRTREGNVHLELLQPPRLALNFATLNHSYSGTGAYEMPMNGGNVVPQNSATHQTYTRNVDLWRVGSAHVEMTALELVDYVGRSVAYWPLPGQGFWPTSSLTFP